MRNRAWAQWFLGVSVVVVTVGRGRRGAASGPVRRSARSRGTNVLRGQNQLAGNAAVRASQHHEVIACAGEKIGEDVARRPWTVHSKHPRGFVEALDLHAAGTGNVPQDRAQIGIVGVDGQPAIA